MPGSERRGAAARVMDAICSQPCVPRAFQGGRGATRVIREFARVCPPPLLLLLLVDQLHAPRGSLAARRRAPLVITGRK